MKAQSNTRLDGSNATLDIDIKTYRHIKRKLQKLELDNYDKVYLIPCNGNSDWHELAEHSALIYYYQVCQVLDLKTKFFADTISLYDQYHIGYIRTLGISNIRQNLQRAKLYKAEQSEGIIHIFTLNRTFTPNEIDSMQKQENQRRLINLNPLDAHNLNPELHQLLVMVATRLHRLCNGHLDRLSSQTIGANIVRLVDDLLADYHRLTMLKKSSHAKTFSLLSQMRENSYELIIQIKVVGETKLWGFEVVTSISENLYTIRDKIEHQIRSAMKACRKEQNKNKGREAN